MTPAPGRYRFSTDQSRGMLIIDFSGFFSSTRDLAGYCADKSAAIARLGRAPNQHVTLCDFSACGPQSPDVVELLRASIEDPAFMSRRLAIVVVGALARMQVQRVVTRPDAACFDRRVDAVAWLTS